ncbi:MAG: hypothetical protein H7Z72_08610 [Bacteroidetes bacterium]|nr:hypothetical protein [Fibrella sp.]
MVSNDMNSWDEDPDELLRQRWQQTFAEFEVPARPSLSRRILNTSAAGQQHKRVSRIVNRLLLLLLSGGLLYPVQLGEKPEPTGHYAARRLRTPLIQPYSRSRDALSTVPIRKFKPLLLPVIDSVVNGSVSVWQPPAHLPTAPVIKASGVEAMAKRRSPLQPLPGNLIGFDRRTVVKSGSNPLFTGRLLAKLVRSPRDNAPIGLSDSVAFSNYKQQPALKRPLIGLNDLPPLPDSSLLVSQTLSDAFPVDIARLKPKGIPSLSHELGVHPGQLPTIRSEPQASSVPVAVRHSRWFVEVVPLSYFQWMSTSPVSTVYLSQVNTPAAFSPATWGYQINGGIRFRRWQAHLSMGQLRRWAYYTVNENRYRVEPSQTDPHRLVRETQGVAENVALPMVGAGLSQQTLLAQDRYIVEVGGQVSYLPTRDQALLGLRGGAGRRLLLSQHTELRVGLTVEYGLNRLLSEQHHLFIHPLVVGIRLRIQPRSNR